MKVRHDDQPILAYKYANLVWWPPGFVGFNGIGSGGDYLDQEPATCMMDTIVRQYREVAYNHKTPDGIRHYVRLPTGTEHRSPHPDCSCGYYAVQDRKHLNSYHASAELDVELYGTVIVCERGYRASHMKVLRIQVGWRGRCARCGVRPPTELRRWLNDIEAVCSTCTGFGYSMTFDQASNLYGVPVTAAPFRPDWEL